MMIRQSNALLSACAVNPGHQRRSAGTAQRDHFDPLGVPRERAELPDPEQRPPRLDQSTRSTGSAALRAYRYRWTATLRDYRTRALGVDQRQSLSVIGSRTPDPCTVGVERGGDMELAACRAGGRPMIPSGDRLPTTYPRGSLMAPTRSALPCLLRMSLPASTRLPA